MSSWLVVVVIQSKSKMQHSKSAHGKFNCITVNFDKTQHGILITLLTSCSVTYTYQWIPYESRFVGADLKEEEIYQKFCL